MDIHIYNLAEYPEHTEAAVGIIYRIRREGGESLEDSSFVEGIKKLKGQTPQTLPATFVVVVNGEPIATMTLQKREVDNYDVGPWLANVFLSSDYQRSYRGAMALYAGFEYAVSAARELEAKKLFLYASTEELIPIYRKAGWNKWEKREHRGRLVNVGARSLE